MDPGPTISRPYTRHKWVGRMICSQANVSAHAQDPLRLPESMTIIKNRTDNVRFSFPLMSRCMLTCVCWGILFLHFVATKSKPSLTFVPIRPLKHKYNYQVVEIISCIQQKL